MAGAGRAHAIAALHQTWRHASRRRTVSNVYARQAGAVAAPTAGLHFGRGMLDDLQTRGVSLAKVTLHVGAGTFQPVRVEDIDEHQMHAERYHVSQECVDLIKQTRHNGGRVVAVGTTSVRALESAAVDGELCTSGATPTFLYRPDTGSG